MGKTALVLGATGVVGRELVRELCESPGYDEVEVWTRREIGFCRPKLRARIIDFEGISDIAPHKFDEIFCALGTTIKQAGSREAFCAWMWTTSMQRRSGAKQRACGASCSYQLRVRAKVRQAFICVPKGRSSGA